MSTPVAASPLTAFQWSVQPAAEEVVRDLAGEILERSPFARHLAARLTAETGTRFVDWLDHLVVPDAAGLRERLETAGFVLRQLGDTVAYAHPGGMFPRVLVGAPSARRAAALKVDSVADFLAAQSVDVAIDGPPAGPLRRACVDAAGDAELWIVERHGAAGFIPPYADERQRARALHHLEQFRLRPRRFADPAVGFAEATRRVDAAVRELGRDWACDLFFFAEREYWQRRNTAAQVQKRRQDRLGLGWANHDHHTYRSSRPFFAPLVAVAERLGFVCRERFYAGREAGWGAQVLEQPVTGHVIFADVDLSPEELMGDFAHEPLAERHELGTIGLWCALHGEAFLEAGMHHLECQFDFDALRDQLEREGVGMLKPFTNFPFLRQAFTTGERWAVDPARVERLERDGRITAEQAVRFRAEGAIGSHLENLERNQGFKGFNQQGVNEIIAATDPRKQ